MQVEIKGSEIIIRLPVTKRPSKSLRTTIVASSNGNQPTNCQFEGKPVIVGVNAYVK